MPYLVTKPKLANITFLSDNFELFYIRYKEKWGTCHCIN